MPSVEDGPQGPQWVAKNGANFGLKNGVGPGGAPFVPGQNHRVDKMAETGMYEEGKKDTRRCTDPSGDQGHGPRRRRRRGCHVCSLAIICTLNALAFARRPGPDDGALCLYIANRHSRLALLQLAIRAFLGRLGPDRDCILVRVEAVEIWSRRHRLRDCARR